MRKPNIGLILTVVLTLIMLVVYLGDVILRLNSVYFSTRGDGIKNYYTLEYHVAHDSSLIHFGGMNYPQGEHVIFTDGFLPLSVLLKIIKPLVDLSAYTHGILNSIILLSIIFAAFFTYKLLREFEINEWVAAVFSPALTFFSPIIRRISGHYSLALVFFIPLIMFLIVRYYKTNKLKYIVWTGVTVLLCSLAHLYYLAIGALLIGGFLLYTLIFSRKEISFKKAFLFITGSVIIPYIFIFILMFFTDGIDDRSKYPYGFLVYKSAWEGVFLNKSVIQSQFFNEIFKPDKINWEGHGFIGHAAILFYFLIYGLFSFIPFLFHHNLNAFFVTLVISILVWFFLKRKRNIFNLVENKAMNALLWAGMLALIISFAFPVNIIPNIYYYIGPIREIRGIGRMNWIFFFAVNIGMVYFITSQIKNKSMRYIILAVITLSVYYNAHKQCTILLTHLRDNDSYAFVEQLVEESPFGNPEFVSKHNAIIGLPAVLNGSENIMFHEDGTALMQFLYQASKKTGLPLISSSMGRTSIQQTLDKAAFFLGPYGENAFLKTLPEGNYAVVMHRKSVLFREGEQFIRNATDSVWSNEYFFVGSISKEKIEKIYKISLPKSGQIPPQEAFYWNDFSHKKNEGYFTPGISEEFKLNKPIIVTEDSIHTDSLTPVEISFWFSDIHQDGLLRGSCEITFMNSNDSVLLYDLQGFGSNIQRIDKNWALYKRTLNLPPETVKFKLALIHYTLKINTINIDNILIRPANKDVFYETKNHLMKNNYFYPKSD